MKVKAKLQLRETRVQTKKAKVGFVFNFGFFHSYMYRHRGFKRQIDLPYHQRVDSFPRLFLNRSHIEHRNTTNEKGWRCETVQLRGSSAVWRRYARVASVLEGEINNANRLRCATRRRKPYLPYLQLLLSNCLHSDVACIERRCRLRLSGIEFYAQQWMAGDSVKEERKGLGQRIIECFIRIVRVCCANKTRLNFFNYAFVLKHCFLWFFFFFPFFSFDWFVLLLISRCRRLSLFVVVDCRGNF